MAAAGDRDAVAVVFASRRWRKQWPGAAATARSAALQAIAHTRNGADCGLEACVVLADDARLRALNARFRGRDAATNVLAFPLQDGVLPPAAGAAAPPRPLGDVVIAYERVLHEAAEQDKPPAAHLAHLVAHGILHLQGFDHRDDEEFARMSAGETAILARLGHGDPYAPAHPARGDDARPSRSRR